ncbi:isochorismatase family cysteine hydrolase [Brucella sp. BE17]|uniref:isochorismatase family cysteine hydrolase n=1 Tax=Brucella sp. BE17 TaxID=3142977 RepID=UPI0031BA1170
MLLNKGLIHGELGVNCVHLCIDVQNLFSEDAPWHVPWLASITPFIGAICERHAERTIFTRFIPPLHAEDALGAWKRYFAKWSELTLEKADPELIQLLPELRVYVPPARILDKAVYSPWVDGRLDKQLRQQGVDTIVLSGAETDLCVLSALFGAVDRGYRVIILSDAVCSYSDQTHDAILALCHERLSEQLEVASTEELLAAWN